MCAGARAYLHHETTTNGIEGIGDDASNRCDRLGDHPLEEDVGILRVVTEHSHRCGIVQSEVSTAVHDDTLHGHSEALV